MGLVFAKTFGDETCGKALCCVVLCAWDLLPETLLYLSAYFDSHRQAYYDLLLAVSQRGAWEEWMTFFLRGMATQARDAITRAGRLQDLANGIGSSSRQRGRRRACCRCWTCSLPSRCWRCVKWGRR